MIQSLTQRPFDKGQNARRNKGTGDKMDQFELTPDEIAQNLKNVQENVAKACERVHRNPSEVAICAVSKLKSVQDIQAAMTAGQKLFVENYVQ